MNKRNENENDRMTRLTCLTRVFPTQCAKPPQLTNRWQFSMVYTLIDNKMMS